MNELIQEIEEDIRRERFERLWHSFGRLMVAVSIAVILVTIGVVVWQNYRQAIAMEKTSQFIQGIDRFGVEDYKGALAAFDQLTEDDRLPFYGLAMIYKATAQTKSGDKDGAARTWQLLSLRDTQFGELGKMMASYKEQPPLVPERSAVFYYSLSEWRAWQLLQQNKKDSAIDLFASLRDDPDAPRTMKGRLALVLQYLAPEKAAPAESIPNE